MGETELPVHDRQSSAGRSHPVELRMIQGITLDRLVSADKGIGERRLRVTGEVIFITMAHALDGDAACLLPAFISTHPVGNDGKSPLSAEFVFVLGFPIEVGVFVVSP